MSLCKACVSGVTHEGTATGKFEKIGGVDCYIAAPAGEYSKEKAILFLPDALGLASINNQLLVDDFAKNGFYTVLIDVFNGDPIPMSILELDDVKKFDWGPWLARHPRAVTRPIIDNVVVALKGQGITSFAAVGYCFGGRYVFDLAFENVTKVSAVSHPSLLKSPEDLEKYVVSSQAPLLINSCEVDGQFPQAAQAKADEIFGSGKAGLPAYKRTYWDGCEHGFAVRGDLSDPKQKAAKEGAFEETVEWFAKYL